MGMSSDAFVAYGIAGGVVNDYDWYDAEDVECTEDIDAFLENAFDEVYEGVKQFNCVFVTIGHHDYRAKALVWVGEDSKYGLYGSKRAYYVEWAETKALSLQEMTDDITEAYDSVVKALSWMKENHPRVYDYLKANEQTPAWRVFAVYG